MRGPATKDLWLSHWGYETEGTLISGEGFSDDFLRIESMNLKMSRKESLVRNRQQCDDLRLHVGADLLVVGNQLYPGRVFMQEFVKRYMLDVGISSTEEIAKSFGVVAPSLRQRNPGVYTDVPTPSSRSNDNLSPKGPADGIRRTIEDALRAAGLMQ